MHKNFYTLCLILFGLSAFAFELSEPIENALMTKQLEQIEQLEQKEKETIKEIKNEIAKGQQDKKTVDEKISTKQ